MIRRLRVGSTRAMCGNLFAAVLALGLGLASVTVGPSQTLQTLVTNGPSSNQINLVVLAEGYTAAQASQFLADAGQMVGDLLGAEPFASYRGAFNAFAIMVASTESGSDHPSQGVFKNTYFNSTFDSYGISEYLTIPPNDRDPNPSQGQGKVQTLLQQLAPQSDMAILLVNDLLYGGAGGQLLICSRNAFAPEMILHEAGHTLAGLGDEYEDPLPGFPDVEEPNTTRETNRASLKWKTWIAPDTPIPTPADGQYADAVGLFEGAHYHTTGWYRPKLDCRMRTLSARFCEVCQEALVLSFYRKIRLIQAASPASTNLLSYLPESLAFNVRLPVPPSGIPTCRWFLDDQPVAGASGTNLVLFTGSLSNGLHRVRVEVRDATSLVRNDPSGRLAQQREWTLDIQPVQLRLGTTRSATNLLITVTGYAPQGIVLESSTNLTQWIPAATNTLTDGPRVFTNSFQHSARKFYYRARTR